MYLLGLLCHVAALPALSLAVADPDAGVRESAVKGLEAIDDRQALDPLIRAMRDPYPPIAVDAVAGVGAVGAHDATHALLGILGDRKLDRSVRSAAARELARSGDPSAIAAAEEYWGGQRIQWRRAFYFAPILYVLAFVGARRASARNGKYWRFALYCAAGASMIALFGLQWFPAGKEAVILWRLIALYPVGVGLGALVIGAGLRLHGSRETADDFGQRMLATVLVMWATTIAWWSLVYVLFIIGLARAWR